MNEAEAKADNSVPTTSWKNCYFASYDHYIIRMDFTIANMQYRKVRRAKHAISIALHDHRTMHVSGVSKCDTHFIQHWQFLGTGI
jgi:hypothetical protein